MDEPMRRAVRVIGVGSASAMLVACIPQGVDPRAAEPRYTMPNGQPGPGGQPGGMNRVGQAPPPPPVRDTRRTNADRRPVAPSTYIVQPGDTLDRIADRTGVEARAIVRANDMVSPYMLHPGQSLLIPGERSYDPQTPR